jgi:hypothetical protein
LGYIRGEKFFDIENLTKAIINPEGWAYITKIQERYGLKVIQDLNQETITLINKLFAKKEAAEKEASTILYQTIEKDVSRIPYQVVPNEVSAILYQVKKEPYVMPLGESEQM